MRFGRFLHSRLAHWTKQMRDSRCALVAFHAWSGENVFTIVTLNPATLAEITWNNIAAFLQRRRQAMRYWKWVSWEQHNLHGSSNHRPPKIEQVNWNTQAFHAFPCDMDTNVFIHSSPVTKSTNLNLYVCGATIARYLATVESIRGHGSNDTNFEANNP